MKIKNFLFCAIFLSIFNIFSLQTLTLKRIEKLPAEQIFSLALGLFEQQLINIKEVKKLLRIAAKNQYVPAIYQLGLIYSNSSNKKKIKKSCHLIAAASRMKYRPALLNIGVNLFNKKDYVRSLIFLIQACAPEISYYYDDSFRIQSRIHYCTSAYDCLNEILYKGCLKDPEIKKAFNHVINIASWKNKLIIYDCLDAYIKNDQKALNKLFIKILTYE